MSIKVGDYVKFLAWPLAWPDGFDTKRKITMFGRIIAEDIDMTTARALVIIYSITDKRSYIKLRSQVIPVSIEEITLRILEN